MKHYIIIFYSFFVGLNCNQLLWAMQQTHQKQSVIFLAPDELASPSIPNNYMKDEQKLVEKTDALCIHSKNMTRPVCRKDRYTYSFCNQIFTSAKKESLSDNTLLRAHCSACDASFNAKTTSIGAMALFLKTIFPTPLSSLEKRAFFISGHGNEDNDICGMSLENFERTLLALNHTAKICIVGSCCAAQPAKLNRIENLNLQYPVVIACLGSDSSSFCDQTTSSDYQGTFNELSQLEYPVQKSATARLILALNLVLKFAKCPENICNILWPGEKNFKILAYPHNEQKEYSLVFNHYVVTQSPVTQPLKLFNDKTINLGNLKNNFCSIDEVLVSPDIPIGAFAKTLMKNICWESITNADRIVKIKKVRHHHARLSKTIALKFDPSNRIKIIKDKLNLV